VCVPPHSSKVPANVPGVVPVISQLPVSLFVYLRSVTTKFCASSQVSVMSVGGFTKAACGAGSIVMFCVCVIVLPQSSVNVQVIVCVPPHSSNVPASVPGTEPDISQLPVSLFVYLRSATTKFCASSQVSVMSAGALMKAACGAGSIVMFCVCVIVLPQSSV